MIEIHKINQKFPGDIIEDIKKGKIHVVCMAQNGLTHLNVYAELYCKIPRVIVNKCVELVNASKETGTLFPMAYISILPKSKNRTDWNTNPQVLTQEEMQTCIKDVFKANKEHLKSEIILFSLEKYYINTELAFAIISDLISEINFEDATLKEVWFEN